MDMDLEKIPTRELLRMLEENAVKMSQLKAFNESIKIEIQTRVDKPKEGE